METNGESGSNDQSSTASIHGLMEKLTAIRIAFEDKAKELSEDKNGEDTKIVNDVAIFVKTKKAEAIEIQSLFTDVIAQMNKNIDDARSELTVSCTVIDETIDAIWKSIQDIISKKFANDLDGLMDFGELKKVILDKIKSNFGDKLVKEINNKKKVTIAAAPPQVIAMRKSATEARKNSWADDDDGNLPNINDVLPPLEDITNEEWDTQKSKKDKKGATPKPASYAGIASNGVVSAPSPKVAVNGTSTASLYKERVLFKKGNKEARIKAIEVNTLGEAFNNYPGNLCYVKNTEEYAINIPYVGHLHGNLIFNAPFNDSGKPIRCVLCHNKPDHFARCTFAHNSYDSGSPEEFYLTHKTFIEELNFGHNSVDDFFDQTPSLVKERTPTQGTVDHLFKTGHITIHQILWSAAYAATYGVNYMNKIE